MFGFSKRKLTDQVGKWVSGFTHSLVADMVVKGGSSEGSVSVEGGVAAEFGQALGSQLKGKLFGFGMDDEIAMAQGLCEQALGELSSEDSVADAELVAARLKSLPPEQYLRVKLGVVKLKDAEAVARIFRALAKASDEGWYDILLISGMLEQNLVSKLSGLVRENAGKVPKFIAKAGRKIAEADAEAGRIIRGG